MPPAEPSMSLTFQTPSFQLKPLVAMQCCYTEGLFFVLLYFVSVFYVGRVSKFPVTCHMSIVPPVHPRSPSPTHKIHHIVKSDESHKGDEEEKADTVCGVCYLGFDG